MKKIKKSRSALGCLTAVHFQGAAGDSQSPGLSERRGGQVLN
jgi:hypothetical protein